ncbi:glycosyltransferase family 2 protein [Bacteroides sp. AM07-16]|uniref:glycosyltransferase family 2 protein n=1 Tax=Parabacteroides bouchesdurhonensis TaxID=1936995 RepID=UPI000E4EDF29|nr:glycosyltransferase family 2 protein [Parabacteroides bouchesdurhonensis]RHJ94900.1 glycosyltransferase family 2 protein [Bacteroides sp. AM07-16]
MKIYSIVIPHKNVPQLLARCLASIPARDDIEILVVDDNSDPDGLKGLQALSISRPDVIFIYTKEGKGAGYARNIGLSRSTGKWLLFADADDYYSDGFIDILDKYKDSEADIVAFGAKVISLKTVYRLLPIRNGKEAMLSRWEVWNIMFCREYVLSNNFVFEEIPVGNDAMFVIKACYYASKMQREEACLYNYIRREGSITFLHSNSDDLCRCELLLRMNQFIFSIGEKDYSRDLGGIFVIMCKNFRLIYPCFKMVYEYKQTWRLLYSFIRVPYESLCRKIKV